MEFSPTSEQTSRSANRPDYVSVEESKLSTIDKPSGLTKLVEKLENLKAFAYDIKVLRLPILFSLLKLS